MSAEFILIVDDNPANLAVLSKSLKDFGYRVRVAMDGETALTQAASDRPALILLDVMMPGIGGFETCQRLKSHPDSMEIPIVFMTALADVENKAKGLSLGAVDYITKPFQQEEVIARVNVHLKMSELLQTLRQKNEQMAIEVERRERAEAQLKAMNAQLENRIKVGDSALTEATEHLQQAQDQVVQSEKLCALGELVAGVAHEINNPIGCITSNMRFVSDYTQQLLDHISIQQAVIEASEKSNKPAEKMPVADHAEEIDLDYIVEDLAKLIESMATSGDRIKAISQSLRTFARADTAQKQLYDLSHGIDGTILILRHRLKAVGDRAEIIIQKQYTEMPRISCYPGQINQVFMNILANAIDAIEERRSAANMPEVPTVQITTALEGNRVVVTIADNAGGMAEAVRARIFESQFTTKSAGKGTGLGLSIAHKIITDTHQGQIECTSKVGTGTMFTIILPL